MKAVSTLCIVMALMGFAEMAWGHFPEGITYLAFQFPDDRIPTIDGDLRDWEMVPKAYWITTEDMYEQLAGMGHTGVWPDLSDFSVTLMVGWHKAANQLYMAAQTYDNLHLVRRPQREPFLIWQQDDFEVMIDADHSGGEYAGIESLVPEESKRQNGAQAQQYVFAFPQADGITGINLSSAATWDLDPPYGWMDFSYKGEYLGSGTTTYEITLTPWDDLNWEGPDQSIIHDLKEGEILGLQFSFGDFDDPEHPTQYHAYWTVSGQDETFKRADRFADFLLAPMEPWAEEPVQPEPSSVFTAEVKLTASDAATNDSFGYSVSISGDHAIAAAPSNDDAGTNSGAAYIFVRRGETWIQQAKLTASDAAAWDEFGKSVSISGDYAIVGAYFDDDAGENSGSAYIFYRNQGGPDTWGQQAKLTALDAAEGDYFGGSVAMDGDYVVVGANWDDDAGDRSGSAYIFYRHQGGTDNWGQQAKLTALDAAERDYFGAEVAIHGDYVLVGAPEDDDAGVNAGSAYIFHRDEGGVHTWSQQAKLTALDAAEDDYFGCAVSISDHYVIVGAYGDDHAGIRSGAAYVFVGEGAHWTQQARLTADDGEAGDEFGRSLSISEHYAIIGARYDDHAGGMDAGSAYVFVRSGSSWSQTAKIAASDAAAHDGFGDWKGVSISGEYAIVGAHAEDHSGMENAGSAYIFLTITESEEVEPPGFYALNFDGVDDYVYVRSSSRLYTPPRATLTVEAWVKPEHIPLSRNVFCGIISKQPGTGGNGVWKLGVHTDGILIWELRLANDPVFQTNSPRHTIELDQWYHVAATLDVNTTALYINGELIQTERFSGDWLAHDLDYPIFIGRDTYNNEVERHLDGWIDEVRIWDRARTQGEIQASMSRPLEGTEEGLVAYWRMDDGAGQMVADDAGDHDGQLGSTYRRDSHDPTWVETGFPYGEEPSPLSTGTWVVVENVAAFPGDTMTVGVRAIDGAEIAAGKLLVHYDPSMLTVISVDRTDHTWSAILVQQIEPEQGIAGASWASASGIGRDSGDLLSVTLTLNPTLIPGDTTQLWIRDLSLVDRDAVPLEARVRPGHVRVIGVPGDVNADGMVDIDDAVLCLRVAVGADLPPILPEYIKPPDFALRLADRNGDDTVNAADALQILMDTLEGLMSATGQEWVVHDATDPLGILWADVSTDTRSGSEAMAADILVHYDPNQLILLDVVPSRTGGLMAFQEGGPGALRVAVVHLEGVVDPQGRVVRLALHGKEDGVLAAACVTASVCLYDVNGRLLTDIEKTYEVETMVPQISALYQNIPNPFNPVTTIAYDLHRATDVTLAVYAVTGQRMVTLVSRRQAAGHYEVTWDGSRFANGVYLYRLEAEGFVETKRMVLIK